MNPRKIQRDDFLLALQWLAYNGLESLKELIERTNTLERQMLKELISRQESRNEAVRSGVADTLSNSHSSGRQGNGLSGSSPRQDSMQSPRVNNESV